MVAKLVPATTGPKPVKLGSSCQFFPCSVFVSCVLVSCVFVSCKPEDGGNLDRFRSHDVREGDRHVPCDVCCSRSMKSRLLATDLSLLLAVFFQWIITV
jgi:hypothetical protein